MFGSARNAARAALFVASALGALCSDPARAAQDGPTQGSTIAWFAGDADSAFARARSEGKPLFLYWGATWCPPCNEVKATIFKRADFIERSRLFIPVYVDGDQPNAQKLADRFRVRGYPTMILFSPDGAEITRLPGEIDAQQYLQMLSLGLGSGRSARNTLRAALGEGSRGVTAAEWTLLASYSWDTDEGQLVAADRLAPTLLALAKACPPQLRASADRLWLRAIVAATGSRGTSGADRVPSMAHVQAVLQDPVRARAVSDVLVEFAPEVVGWLTDPGSAERAELIERWGARLAAFAADTTFATADRLDALTVRANLLKLADPNQAVPPALVEAIRTAAAKADRDTTDRFERQAVISSAADALSAAGLGAESDELLKAELSRSAAPYYFMVDLAVNARKRGDAAAALDWYDKAYAGAQGPATRIQWGARYVIALTELAPTEPDRIDRAIARVIADLDPAPETFYGRNRAALEKMGAALRNWDPAHEHTAVMHDAIAKLDAVCDKLPQAASERAVCAGMLRPSRS